MNLPSHRFIQSMTTVSVFLIQRIPCAKRKTDAFARCIETSWIHRNSYCIRIRFVIHRKPRQLQHTEGQRSSYGTLNSKRIHADPFFVLSFYDAVTFFRQNINVNERIVDPPQKLNADDFF